jgi:hypothetical protein
MGAGSAVTTWQASVDLLQPSFRAAENTVSAGLFAHRRVVPGIAPGLTFRYHKLDDFDALAEPDLPLGEVSQQLRIGVPHPHDLADRPRFEVVEYARWQFLDAAILGRDRIPVRIAHGVAQLRRDALDHQVGYRVFQRIGQEYATKIHRVDVVNSSDAAHLIVWKNQGILAPFVSEDVAKHFPAEHKDADGMFSSFRLTLCPVAYNTTQL